MIRRGPRARTGRPRVALALMALLGLWACATPAGPGRSVEAGSDSLAQPGSAGAAAFEPWLLPESPLPVSHGQPAPVPVTATATPPTKPVDAAPVVTQPAPGADAASGAPEGTPLWTVQLYSGQSPARARAIAAEARLLFPEHPVELLEEESGLRVRVGRFDNRGSAEGLSRRAVRLGFDQAWITESPRRN